MTYGIRHKARSMKTWYLVSFISCRFCFSRWSPPQKKGLRLMKLMGRLGQCWMVPGGWLVAEHDLIAWTMGLRSVNSWPWREFSPVIFPNNNLICVICIGISRQSRHDDHWGISSMQPIIMISSCCNNYNTWMVATNFHGTIQNDDLHCDIFEKQQRSMLQVDRGVSHGISLARFEARCPPCLQVG